MDEEPICRTCLSTSSKFISLDDKFTYFGQSFSLSAMIASCAPIKIDKDDGLPKRICEYCSTLLQISFMVRIRTLQAETKLRKYLQKKQEGLQTTSEDSLEPLSLPLFSEVNIKNLFKFNQDTKTETDPLNVDIPKEISNDSVPSVCTQNKYSIHSIKSNTTVDNKLTIEYNPNNTFYLTQKDLEIIQTYLQSIQTDPIQAGTKFIVIKANELTNISQPIAPFDSNLYATKEYIRVQNAAQQNNLSLKITNVQTLSTSNIANENTYVPLNKCNNDSFNSGQEIVTTKTVDCSRNNITPTTSCMNTERNSFKSEFQKFISELEKSTPVLQVTSSTEELRPTIRKTRNKRTSINLDEDDNISRCNNENNSQNMLNDSLGNNNNSRKLRRLTQEEQSIIIIDE